MSRTSSSSKNSSNKKVKANAKTRKRVRIYSPENKVHMYSLSSGEKANKKKAPNLYKRCPKYPEMDDFPCYKAYTVFENMYEYEKHKDDFGLRGNSKSASIKKHYAHMREKLSSQGKASRKIPLEYRLYDKDTGEIHDLRYFETTTKSHN